MTKPLYSGFMHVRGDEIHIRGIDLGAPLKIVARNGVYFLCHTDGHMGWVARGEQGYYPAMYYLLRKRFVQGKPYALVLEEWESGRNWMQVKKEALEALERKGRDETEST